MPRVMKHLDSMDDDERRRARINIKAALNSKHPISKWTRTELEKTLKLIGGKLDA